MAVYTDVSDAELTQFMAAYDLGAVASCKGIAEGVENSNFLLATEQGSFILTLYERRVDARDLPFFLQLMEHLATHGFACPTPVATRDGTVLRQLCGRPAALISFLQGLWPRAIQPFHCAGVGQTLAELHEAAADFAFSRPNSLSLDGWSGLLQAMHEDLLDDVEPGLAAELRAELATLRQAWPTNLPQGVCHADLFPDNVFFRDGKVSGVIDFYFACTDAWAYDVAICLNAWCFAADHTWQPDRSRILLEAYQSVRPLEHEERRAMPILARGAALRFLLTRLFDWLNRSPGALVNPKDPGEYLAKLRFHRTATPESYGL
jgi:homoserine kinase type II